MSSSSSWIRFFFTFNCKLKMKFIFTCVVRAVVSAVGVVRAVVSESEQRND